MRVSNMQHGSNSNYWATKLPYLPLKRVVFVCFFLYTLLFLPRISLAIYDILGIDVMPRDGNIRFCIDPDYSNTSIGEPYVAAIWQGNLYFLSCVNSNIIITPYDPSVEMPIFRHKSEGKFCFGPFSVSALNGIQLFGAVGTSLGDALENGRYGCFYAGMPSLPTTKARWTIMIYMIGSSLEDHAYRLASKDIEEMIEGSKALKDDLVNVVLCTGGAWRTGWQTTKHSIIKNGQLYVIEDQGKVSMTAPATLSNFVYWAERQFPAKHYGLILWDHGGGADGFGYYELKDGTHRHMDLSTLYQAFQSIRQLTQKELDIVAYDACLMGSIEVAEVTATCAKAMGASVEVEPYHGIDYSYLLSSIAKSFTETNQQGDIDGIAFGNLILSAYIHQAKETGTYYRFPITYGIYDLTKLNELNDSLSMFCQDFENKMEKGAYLTYEALSQGIIRTVAYPTTKKRGFGDFDQSTIPVDLPGLLNSISTRIPSLGKDASRVVESLGRFIVDKEDNIESLLGLTSGGLSVDIGTEDSYVSLLPSAFSFLRKGIEAYIKKKQADHFVPEGTSEVPECPEGMICAPLPTWLLLNDEDVLGVDALFGRNMGEYTKISLVTPIFRCGSVHSPLEVRLDANNCSVYRIYTGQGGCADVTLTQKYEKGMLVGEAYVNGVRASLIVTDNSDGSLSCSVIESMDGLWSRITDFQPGDIIQPVCLYLRDSSLEEHIEPAIVVPEDGTVVVKKAPLPPSNPTIIASFFGANGQRKLQTLCISESCAYCGISILSSSS